MIETCGSEEVYNTATGQCEDIGASGQVGMCPPDKPTWNPNTLACEKCNLTQPYWNSTSKKCESCPNNTEWDYITENCLSNVTKCPKGKQLNNKTNQCEAIKCPTDAPVLNLDTN